MRTACLRIVPVGGCGGREVLWLGPGGEVLSLCHLIPGGREVLWPGPGGREVLSPGPTGVGRGRGVVTWSGGRCCDLVPGEGGVVTWSQGVGVRGRCCPPPPPPLDLDRQPGPGGGVVTWSRGEGGVVTWSGGRCCDLVPGEGGVVTWSQGVGVRGRCCPPPPPLDLDRQMPVKT